MSVMLRCLALLTLVVGLSGFFSSGLKSTSDPAGPNTATNPFTYMTGSIGAVGSGASFKFSGSYTLSNGTTQTVSGAPQTQTLNPVVGVNTRQWLVDALGNGTLSFMTSATQPNNAIAEAFYTKDTSSITLGNADGTTTTYSGYGDVAFPGGGYYPFLDMTPIADGTMQICAYFSGVQECHNDAGSQNAAGMATWGAAGNLTSGQVRILTNSTSTKASPSTLNGGFTFVFATPPDAGQPITLSYWHTFAMDSTHGPGTNSAQNSVYMFSMIHLLPSGDDPVARASAFAYIAGSLPGSGVPGYDTTIDYRPPRTVTGYLTPDGNLHVLAVGTIDGVHTPTLMTGQTISDYSATDQIGNLISGITLGTKITGQSSGPTGGTGVYTTSNVGQTVGSAASPDAIVLTAQPCANMASNCTQTDANAALVQGACPLYSTAFHYSWIAPSGADYGDLDVLTAGSAGNPAYYCGFDLTTQQGYFQIWTKNFVSVLYNRQSAQATNGGIDARQENNLHVQQNEFQSTFTPAHFFGTGGVCVSFNLVTSSDATRNYFHNCSQDAFDYNSGTNITITQNMMSSVGWLIASHADDIQDVGSGANSNITITKNNIKNCGLVQAQTYRNYFYGIYNQFYKPDADIYLEYVGPTTLDTVLVDSNITDCSNFNYTIAAPVTNLTVTNNRLGRNTAGLPSGIVPAGATKSGNTWSDTGGPATGF